MKLSEPAFKIQSGRSGDFPAADEAYKAIF